MTIAAGQSMIIGTYTEKLAHVDGKAPGILGAKYRDGKVSDVTVLAEVRNPSWLVLSADGRNLYSVAETVEFEGEPGGGVVAFSRDPVSGDLTLLNTAPSGGVEPAYVGIDPSGSFVIVANYRNGTLAVYSLGEGGRLGEMVDHVRHAGSSVHPVRQTGPHAHQVLFDPLTGYALVPDLGVDAVVVYELTPSGRLVERKSDRFSVHPGAGPRHLAFHPGGQYLFLVDELTNDVVLLRRAKESRFEQVQVISTLPSSFDGHSQAAAIRVSATGELVFASNRGLHSIAVLSFDPGEGRLSFEAVEPSRGSEPRDFVLSPDGSQLLVANQDSSTIEVFSVDETARQLQPVSSAEVPTPVCLLFA
ncbi:MAG TPA: lactonase family protein [Acidimicrobiales bacterium]|nr:lactonase family protein [Acidimicrobiales bacterium]